LEAVRDFAATVVVLVCGGKYLTTIYFLVLVLIGGCADEVSNSSSSVYVGV
jgi:hypothetical protein